MIDAHLTFDPFVHLSLDRRGAVFLRWWVLCRKDSGALWRRHRWIETVLERRFVEIWQ